MTIITMTNAIDCGHRLARARGLVRSCASGVLTAIFISLSAGQTWAQGFGTTDYPYIAAPQMNFAASNFMNLSVLNQVQGQGARSATPANLSTMAPPTAAPLHTAETLARAYSPRQPGPMESVFRQSLDVFAKAAQKARQPADDVAVALAFFVAANYAASNGQPLVADADFPRLVAQMRASLGSSPAFQQADAKMKRQTFEQLAMVGMFVHLAKMDLDKNPKSAPAQHLRDHARANLASVIGVPADRMTLAQGQLVLR